MSKKILLLGSTGQVGSALCNTLSFNSNYVLVCPTRDILDLEAHSDILPYVSGIKPDLIVNCAAYTAVDDAERNVCVAEKINKIAVEELVKGANLLNIPLIHLSTDYVFDGNKRVPYTEDDTPNPINVYGKTKLEGDLAIISACNCYTIFRTSWLYGSGKNFPNTIKCVIDKIRKEKFKKSVSVVNDQIGSPTNADDVAYMISYFIKKNLVSDQKEVYNLSSLGQCSWYDFALFIAKTNNINDISFVPIKSSDYISSAKRPKFSVLDCTKLLKKKIVLPTWESAYEQSNNRRQNF